MESYRSVSNLTFLCKVIEQAILDQLWKDLEENKIIPVQGVLSYMQGYVPESAV